MACSEVKPAFFLPSGLWINHFIKLFLKNRKIFYPFFSGFNLTRFRLPNQSLLVNISLKLL